MTSRYAAAYKHWRDDPEGFWREAAAAIDWIRPPKRIFDAKAGVHGRWFPDATCNTCRNAVDRHALDGHGARAAIIYDSPVTGTRQTISYAVLLDEVSTLAAVLRRHGVGKGDRVLIYMPMTLEGVIAMQACARIGVTHSVVFGGFSAKALQERIIDAGAVAEIGRAHV